MLLFALASACPVCALESDVTASVRVSGDATPVAGADGVTTLRITKPRGQARVSFIFKDGVLDLSAFRDVSFVIKNGTTAELDVLVGATSERKSQWSPGTSGRFFVRRQEELALTALMPRNALPGDHPHVKSMGNLFAFPWGHHRHWRTVDAAAITQARVQVSWRNAEVGQTIEIGRPRGAGEFSTDPARLEKFQFPMVDAFGQAVWLDWPGKVRNVEELREDGRRDLAFAETVSSPGAGRSRFGGLTGGPELKATGFFRVEKIKGRWWFVDPDGSLFWSLGVNCVGAPTGTKVKGREHVFPEPWRGQPSVDLYDENLKLKYGPEDWPEENVRVSIARMFDWGLNTVGAWSIPGMEETEKVPYTLIIHTEMRGAGSIGKIPDPFAKSFQDGLEHSLERAAKKHALSPWLLGIFIDNELDWQGGNKLASEVMKSGEGAPARVALVDFLRKRYGSVAALNKAWGTDFPDLTAIKPDQSEAGTKAYGRDLDDFMDLFAEQYFSICRAAMDKYFPNHLYLGSRFHVFNPIITKAASRHCDVLSVNIYQHGCADFSIDTDQDRPWLISEFHFGMRDLGNLGVGLTWAADARNQADLFQAYASEALRHPNFVGAHWFAWNDQGVTGRGDGENFGVGLVTVTDRPVKTLINAVRTVSKELHAYRLGDFEHRIHGPEQTAPSESLDEAGAAPNP